MMEIADEKSILSHVAPKNAIVAPAGIEPASSESESEILSIELRSRISQKVGQK